jgi:peptidoglycan/LPS O-acetylase OafA/YrhL
VFFGFVVFPYLKAYFGKTPNETATLVHYLTFTSNFEGINKGVPDASILGVLWSIAVEEQFYLIWPLLLSIVPNKKYNQLFAAILIATFVFRALNDSYQIHEKHTLSCIGDMTIGAWGAYLVQQEKWKQKVANWKQWQVTIIYLLFASVFFFRKELLMGNYYLRIVERSLIAVIILLIILEQNFCNNSLFKMKHIKWASNLGIISYGLYCLHFIGILVTTTLTEKLHLNNGFMQVMLLETSIALLLTIIISKLSYTYFENPFLKLKEKFAYITK